MRLRPGWRAATSPRSTAGRAALLSVTLVIAVCVPALSYVAAAGDGRGLVGRWSYFPSEAAAAGYVVTDLRCATPTSARSLNDLFVGGIRPVLGLDNPHVIDLGGDRYLWLFNDTFVDYTNRARSLIDARFLLNSAILQERDCFRLVLGGTRTEPAGFEQGLGQELPYYFWPLGGQTVGGRVQVFWAEMLRTRDQPAPGNGVNRRPVRTWLATYDVDTLERLDFRPALNDGVFPQYGYAVASDDTHTYLFGNSNLLDLTFEGGFYAGPHSATKMYLARVPRGDLAAPPEYRTADGWSDDPADARPFSERFWTDNGMQPVYLDGRWVAVTKVDGFWGTQTIVETADDPWGPWTIVSQREVEPVRGFDEMTNYQPIILPYRDSSGDLIVVMSENARVWKGAVDDMSMYRPQVYTEPWPFEE
jgi:hypothetical protein